MAADSTTLPPTNTGGGFWSALDHLSGLGSFWWDKTHQTGGSGVSVTASGSSVSASASPGALIAGVAAVVLVVLLITRK